MGMSGFCISQSQQVLLCPHRLRPKGWVRPAE